MAVYILAQIKEYVQAGLDYVQTYKQQMLNGESQSVRYVYTDIPNLRDIELYEKAGICKEQILSMHRYFTDNQVLALSVKAEDKLEELKDSLHYTSVDYRDSDIRLIKDGYVIATISCSEEDGDYVRGIYYFNVTKLVRAEIYMDGLSYIEYFKTAKSENGLYAKLVRRTFCGGNGLVAYDQIFEGGEEWYLFPNGRRCTKSQFMVEFVKRIELSVDDIVFLDGLMPEEFIRAIFTFGKAARIVVMAHAGRYLVENGNEPVLKEYPYNWIRYAEMLDAIIVSTSLQKEMLEKELKKYHCNVPDIKVDSIEGEFTYAVLHESYGGNMALSWSFKGKSDGFGIYDEFGVKIYETRNVHQHYFLIKGYNRENGFAVKAFVDTSMGKMVIAESELLYLCERQYEKPVVSLIVPIYNAEDFIVRTMDNALAQSFFDLEIIAVDDGCEDSTPNILTWYAEKYKNVIVIHKENGGVAAARGEYIGFMDNDDMIHPDMVESLYGVAKENKCDIACTSIYEIRNSGYEIVACYPMEEDMAISIEKYFAQHFASGYMWTVYVWNKLYRASLVKQHMFPELISDDEAWTPYILSWADNICWINGRLYEHDGIIRTRTLFNEWIEQSNDELFDTHIRATMFYLKEGNPKRMKQLKVLAEKGVLEWGKIFSHDGYEEMWRKMDETF